MEQFKASNSRSSIDQIFKTIAGWRKTDKDRPIHGLTSTGLWPLGFILVCVCVCVCVAQQVNNRRINKLFYLLTLFTVGERRKLDGSL